MPVISSTELIEESKDEKSQELTQQEKNTLNPIAARFMELAKQKRDVTSTSPPSRAGATASKIQGKEIIPGLELTSVPTKDGG